MKILSVGAKWLFILCLPFLLLTASLGWAANSQWLYQYGFEKYNVSSTTGLADSELKKTAIGLISYFNSDEEYINLTVVKNGQPVTLFNQREVSHLKDVKELIRLDYRVFLGTLVYTLGYTLTRLFRPKERQQLARGLIGGASLTLALMFAFALGALFGFDQLFLQFHLLSFTNELWQLDPTRDYLIMLFPQGFWYDATLISAGTTAGLAIIWGGVGYLLKRKI